MKLSKVFIMTGVSVVLASCGQSSSKTALNNKPTGAGVNTAQPVPTAFKEMKPEEIKRECSGSEAQTLKAYEQLIQDSNASVDGIKGKKDVKVIKAGATAIEACDNVIESIMDAGACRITKTTIAGTKVAFYDGYRVNQKCKNTEKYLIAYGVRPLKNSSPVSQPPVVQTNPTPVAPEIVTSPVNQPPVAGGTLRQCSADEF